jgi:ParB family chromosome partitioning protein
MKVIDVPIGQIHEAAWNPNVMDAVMHSRLRRSVERFGLVVPLVVRPIGDALYETVGGAQRLSVLWELGIEAAPCVVVQAGDANARLLAQALNRIQGEDDLGLRAELVRAVLEQLPEGEVLAMLPETPAGLKALATLGQPEMASYLQNWQQAQQARLKHLTFQFTPLQLEIIEEALARVLPQARNTDSTNPNPRGTALYLLCLGYLEREERRV